MKHSLDNVKNFPLAGTHLSGAAIMACSILHHQEATGDCKEQLLMLRSDLGRLWQGCLMRAPEDLKKKLAEQEAGNPLNLPPMPEGFSACELVKRDFPEPLWIIPELLTEGLGILAGRPKTGKSWLALGLSIAGATGGRALGKIKVDKSPVLYLALEDTPRRLKSRLQQVLCGNMAPESLYFQTEWPRIDQGALPLLEKWLEAHPETRFVIIDTLAKLWPKGNGKDSGSAYHQDYNTLSAIKTIADLHQISILLVTHLRKSPVPTFCISLYLTGPIPSSNVKI